MPRGPEEQDGLLAGGRGAGEVRDGHGCGEGGGGDWLVNLWRWRGIFWSSESVERDFQTLDDVSTPQSKGPLFYDTGKRNLVESSFSNTLYLCNNLTIIMANPTLTVEVPPQDPAAADDNKKVDQNVTAELTPTNSSTTTISSPKDTTISPIANEVSVETSGLITTDTTLSPSSAGTGGEAPEVKTEKENFEIEATESKETKEVGDAAALKMQQLIVTGSKILLKKHDVAAEAEDDQYTYEEDLFNAEEDGGDDDDNAKMSLGETSSVRIVTEASISHCALTSNFPFL